MLAAPGYRPQASPHIRLLTVDKCNLFCGYCHFQASSKDGGMMSVAVAARSLREFIGAVRTRGHGQAHVSVYGGEPLLNAAVLQAVLEIVAGARADGFVLTPVVNTNGTLLTEEIAAQVRDAGGRVHISLDGPTSTSNALRLNRGGRETLRPVLTAIGRLRAAGCPFQINSMLTAANQDGLEGLVEFADTNGCAQIFMALPDQRATTGASLSIDECARRLLSASATAQRRGVPFSGPWAVGLHPESRRFAWPPLNVAVRGDGRVFFPYVPTHLLDSIAEAFDAEKTREIEQEWQATVASCAGCPLLEPCNGYLKMMARYHTGTTDAAQRECDLARHVATIGTTVPVRTFVTPLDLMVRPDGEDVAIEHPFAGESSLVVSGDVLRLLNWFRSPGNLPLATAAFPFPELRGVFDALTARGLLVPPEQDTDVQLLTHLSAGGQIERLPGILAGTRAPRDRARLGVIAPHLAEAITRLPQRLRADTMQMCIFGAADRSVMASIVGREADDPLLDWMAGTVFGSVVVLNLDLCEGIIAHNGKRRTEEFVRELTHEMAHVALRKHGVHVPIWLEEGLCQLIAGQRPEPDALARASIVAKKFAAFVQDQASAGGRGLSLLEFSSDPIDENAAYILACDYTEYTARDCGLEALLDRLHSAGWDALRGRVPGLAPFDVWVGDLQDRVSVASEDRNHAASLRRVDVDGRALVYDRMIGGFAILDGGSSDDRFSDASGPDRRMTLQADAERLSTIARWQSAIFARRRGFHLRLTLEDTCNMACTYCYEGTQPKNRMTVAVADRAVAAWRDLLGAGDLAHSSIRFFGGEPLLNWPVMEHVLGTATVGLPERAIRWVVNTNGTLLRDQHVEIFRTKGDALMVSLSCDGVGLAHDAARPLRGGGGTFGKVERALQLLCGAGITVWVSTVMGEHNADGLVALVEYLARLRQQYAAPVGLSLDPLIGDRPMPQVAARVKRAFFDAVAACRREGVPVTGKPFTAFEALLRPDGATGHFCAITGRELAVTPTGTIRLCHAIAGNDYGALEENVGFGEITIPASIRSRVAGQIDACRGCEVEGLCGGGCMAQSIRQPPSQDDSQSIFCDLMRNTFRRSVRELVGAAGAWDS